jgi:hypothetical protein
MEKVALCQPVEVKKCEKMSKKWVKFHKKMSKISQNQKMGTPNESGG